MPAPTAAELSVLEDTVADALERLDPSALPIVGFGEIAVALSWPDDDPAFVCKRTPPFTPAEFERYRAIVDRYVDELNRAGLSVAPTTVAGVERGDDIVAYLVQPLLDPDTLGDRVLQRSDPDPDHPFLSALADTLTVASRRLSIDAQVTNWAWDGTTPTLLDVGTPFLWDEDGRPEFDMTPFLAMLPAPVRGLVRRDLTKLLIRWQTPRGVAVDLVANLHRVGMAEWIDPTLVALNRVVAADGPPVTAAEAHDAHVEDLKTWPRLKRLQRLQRSWETKVRRRPYQFFIQNSFDGTTS